MTCEAHSFGDSTSFRLPNGEGLWRACEHCGVVRGQVRALNPQGPSLWGRFVADNAEQREKIASAACDTLSPCTSMAGRPIVVCDYSTGLALPGTASHMVVLHVMSGAVEFVRAVLYHGVWQLEETAMEFDNAGARDSADNERSIVVRYAAEHEWGAAVRSEGARR